MHTTRVSLIHRLQSGGHSAWAELVDTYQPMVRRWLQRNSVSEHDAEDIAQEVFLRMTKGIQAFEHNGNPGAFRSWMHRVTLNVMRNFRRVRATRPLVNDGFGHVLQQLEDPESELSCEFHRQHNLFVLQKLLAGLRHEFSDANLELFRRYCVLGEEPSKIASDLGVTKNAVYVAKFRVMKALKASVEDLDSLMLVGDADISDP